MAGDQNRQGERLRLFLKHIGLLQNDLATELGRSRQLVWRYASSKAAMPVEVVNHLIKKHRLNPEWWHTGKGKYTTGADARTSIATDVALLNQKVDDMYKVLDFYKKENHRLSDELEAIKKHLGL